MADLDDVWIPLVDEPIGAIVARIQEEDDEINRLVASPRKLLAFRTFAYLRVGILLGQLLVEHEIDDYDGSETWVESLLRDARHHGAVAAEVRAVAEEVGRDPTYADEGPVGPDDEALARFREFARQQLGG